VAVLRVAGKLLLGVFHLAPWAWTAALGAMLVLTVSQVGHFPSYGNPDPKQVAGIWAPYWAVFLLFFPSILSPLVVGGEQVWRLSRTSGVRIGALGLYALGFALFGAVMFADVFGLRNWVMD
jgi:hypothetical protein